MRSGLIIFGVVFLIAGVFAAGGMSWMSSVPETDVDDYQGSVLSGHKGSAVLQDDRNLNHVLNYLYDELLENAIPDPVDGVCASTFGGCTQGQRNEINPYTIECLGLHGGETDLCEHPHIAPVDTVLSTGDPRICQNPYGVRLEPANAARQTSNVVTNTQLAGYSAEQRFRDGKTRAQEMGTTIRSSTYGEDQGIWINSPNNQWPANNVIAYFEGLGYAGWFCRNGCTSGFGSNPWHATVRCT